MSDCVAWATAATCAADTLLWDGQIRFDGYKEIIEWRLSQVRSTADGGLQRPLADAGEVTLGTCT